MSSAGKRWGSVSEPAARNAPRQIAAASHPGGDDRGGQTVDEPPPRVGQSGAPDQGGGVGGGGHPQPVAGGGGVAGCGQHVQLGGVAVQGADRDAKAVGQLGGVQVHLDAAPPRFLVHGPGEAEQGDGFRAPTTSIGEGEPAQLVGEGGCH